MADYDELNDLFDGGLDSKMDFLNETTKSNNDGIYRVDPKKALEKSKGYRATVRFLPNLSKDGKVGQSAIEKISHYVDMKGNRELSGYYDSAKNFGEKCGLTDLFYTMLNSNNAILQEKAKSTLKYQRKYYSYVLIIEDAQQPELVGKVMIMQYGKTIRDKIMAEKNGEISGVPCNVFDLAEGKDFVLIVKEISTGDETYPDYKSSSFQGTTSSLPVYSKEKRVFKNIPLTEDGKVVDGAKAIVKDFLLDREHEIDEFTPKRLTEEQQSNITEITNILTGKATSSYSKPQPKTEDFEFSDVAGGASSPAETEDDFFSDDF